MARTSPSQRLAAELVLDARADTAERPVWDDRLRRLLWVNVPRGELHLFDPASGRDEIAVRHDQPVGCAALRGIGGFVVGDRDGFALFDPASARPSLRIRLDRANRTVRMNDGVCDPIGRFVAGTLDLEGDGGALYRLEASAWGYRVDVLERGVREANGLDWSVDGSVLYWIDTARGSVFAFDYDIARGTVANRRVFVEIDHTAGVPDGLIVDAEGGVWVALYGGGAVRRYDPTGRLTMEVAVPVRRPTCPTFGGVDLDVLFITSQRVAPNDPDYPDQPEAGGIFACRPGVIGRPARRFAR